MKRKLWIALVTAGALLDGGVSPSNKRVNPSARPQLADGVGRNQR